jgi:hypothetical protein
MELRQWLLKNMKLFFGGQEHEVVVLYIAACSNMLLLEWAEVWRWFYDNEEFGKFSPAYPLFACERLASSLLHQERHGENLVQNTEIPHVTNLRNAYG